MHAISPADSFAERKQPDMVDDRVAACSVGAGIARAAHDVRDLLALSQSLENRFELLSLGRIDDIVGIEPKGIIPVARASAALRAAAKSSTQTKSKTCAPNDRAISAVRSVLPVSTTTISSNTPRTDSRQAERFFSSSRTIIVRLTLAFQRSFVSTRGHLPAFSSSFTKNTRPASQDWSTNVFDFFHPFLGVHPTFRPPAPNRHLKTVGLYANPMSNYGLVCPPDRRSNASTGTSAPLIPDAIVRPTGKRGQHPKSESGSPRPCFLVRHICLLLHTFYWRASWRTIDDSFGDVIMLYPGQILWPPLSR